jgi:hypothetical protein
LIPKELPTPKNSKVSTKNAIIETVSEKFPLSAKEIYFSIKKNYGLSVTYQAIHKTIKELIENSILVKENNKYKISKIWVEEIKKFSKDLEKKYLKKEIYEDGVPSTVEVKSIWEFYMFILEMLQDKNFSTNNKSICIQSEYVWISPIGTENEWNSLKEFLQENQIFVAIRSNTNFDKMMKRCWENVGVKYKLGVNTETSRLMMDIVIVGDYVLQAYFPEEFVTKIKEIYSNVKSIDDIKMDFVQDFFYKKYDPKINILIHQNKSLAEQLRKQTEKHFKE